MRVMLAIGIINFQQTNGTHRVTRTLLLDRINAHNTHTCTGIHATHTHTHTHMHTRTRTHTRTHIHIHTRVRRPLYIYKSTNTMLHPLKDFGMWANSVHGGLSSIPMPIGADIPIKEVTFDDIGTTNDLLKYHINVIK